MSNKLETGDHHLWYKDAIIYELPVKAFCDRNDDGIGDFRGLIEKLDYLQNLGVSAVWLLPFYPSPLRDDGYDIADYLSIHPAYGKLADFRNFLKEAHRRNIRVITELVLNHTSDRHAWFQRSRRAKPGSAWRNFYVWSNTPEKYGDARIIFQDFERSNWTWDHMAGAYFWHRFYSHQPDLNYDHPRVHQEMLRVLDFWLELGVDGLRLDAVPYLYERDGTNCENLPETHAFLKKVRAHVDKKFKNRMLLAEANQWAEDAVAYFGNGDECHAAFNFPVMPRLYMAIQMEDRFPIIDIFDPPPAIPENCQWVTFLRNHDELTLEMVTDEERDYMYRMFARDPRAKINLGIRRRLAPLMGNNRRRIELMNILLFSLPGTPVIYYGDEIGMGDNYYLGDRDGVRTPMQWSPDRNAGFSRANPQKLYLPLIIDPEYHFESINVENQEKNLSSLLWWMKRVIAMRKRFKALSRGNIRFLSPPNHRVLAFTRRWQDETLLVVVNLSRFSQAVELDLSAYAGFSPEEVFSRSAFPPIRESPYLLTLGPHNYYWFSLRRARDTLAVKPAAPFLSLPTAGGRLMLTGELKEKLEGEILGAYLPRCRWFSGKGRTIRRINLSESASLPELPSPATLLLLEVQYSEGSPELYFLPLLYLSGAKAELIKRHSPQGIIARLQRGEERGILFDGVYDAAFREKLLELVARRRRLRGRAGEFAAFPGRKLKEVLDARQLPRESNVLKAEQSNTSINYADALILKLFRRPEAGTNPDLEITKILTEKAHFPHIPAFRGAIEYRQPGAESATIGVLQDFIPNQGDAWTFTLETIERYYERVLSRRGELGQSPPPAGRPERQSLLEEMIGGFFLEMISLLGRRTGQLHLALASVSERAEFAPEPFSLLYQRAVYQSMKGLVRRVFELAERNAPHLPAPLRAELDEVLRARPKIVKRMGRITQEKISAMKIRIHGDYHLGQVLYTGKDFVIFDFEGEPARPLGERRLKRCCLRDGAGMIRSFHYAAYAGFLKHVSVRGEDAAWLEPWMEAWSGYVSNVFLRSYLETVRDAPFLPRRKEEFSLLLQAFMLEKAVYEIGYELNHRPDWLVIPLRGIKSILGNRSGSKTPAP